MKPLAILLVVGLAGGGYWLWQSQTKTPEVSSADDDSDAQRSKSQADLVSKSTARDGDGGAAKKSSEPQGPQPTTGRRADNRVTVEPPMTVRERAEIQEHFDEMCNAALPEEQFSELVRAQPNAFGDLSTPDMDAPLVRRAFLGLVGSRMGLDDAKTPPAKVHAGLATAELAVRNLSMGLREGSVRFRLTEDGQEGQGRAKAKPHTQEKLFYRWRVGAKVVEMTVDRNRAAPEFLDHFDPERRQG